MSESELRSRVTRLDEDVRAIWDTVDDIKEAVDGHTITLARHGAILDGHMVTLARHGEVLDEHTGMLREILRRLEAS